MTRWQADEVGMMRLFRLLPDARMSDAAYERIRRRILRRARLLRWEQRLSAEAQNVWACVFLAVVLLWLVWR